MRKNGAATKCWVTPIACQSGRRSRGRHTTNATRRDPPKPKDSPSVSVTFLLRPNGEQVPAGRMRGTTETKHKGMCLWEGVSPPVGGRGSRRAVAFLFPTAVSYRIWAAAWRGRLPPFLEQTPVCSTPVAPSALSPEYRGEGERDTGIASGTQVHRRFWGAR